MSEPWWGREAAPDARATMVPGPGGVGVQPELLPAGRRRVRAAVLDRVPAFTPEWTRLDPDDAGVALVRLFGAQLEPVLRRLNRLPEKLLVEHLRVAGVGRLPATAAAALLEVQVSPAARRPVLVAAGFQVGADPATGQGDRVIFETERTVHAVPGEIAELAVEQDGLVTLLDAGALGDGRSLLAFGPRPRHGATLWIGLAGEVGPFPTLSFGVVVATAAGPPPPAASGGTGPSLRPPPPLLRWDALDGGRLRPVVVALDETDALRRSGVVELRPPRRWEPARPGRLPGTELRRWLRVRLLHGSYVAAPALVAVRLNVVRAVAARTIRNEALERLPAGRGRSGARLRVSQVPVLPGSLVVEADEDLEREPSGIGGAAAATSRWREVDSLALSGPDDRVFVADHATGELTFGDGVRGARLPEGFRNVRAVSYRVGGGAAGGVEAEAVSSIVTSVPFVTAVTNPFPASGGTDAEPEQDAVRRGPEELRAGGRAVAPADYGLLARRAPGAEVARAHGVAGFDPDLPGAPIPGVVGVLVVPPERGEGPPVPDEATLSAVARFLAGQAAPAGVRVVAAAPRFHLVRVEARVVVDPAVALDAAIQRSREALDRYLHPLRGGDVGTGWPFGAPLRFSAVLRRLLASVPELRAVPRLNFVVDGVRLAPCADFQPAPHALLWPDGHELVPVEQEEPA
jgi:predicted phage baseplate assembly protein